MNQKKQSKLEAWFDLNKHEFLEAKKRHETVWPCKDLHYLEIPNRYTWEPKDRYWKKRQRRARHGEVVARMYQVSPKNPELYALRLLLLNASGADLMHGEPFGEDADGDPKTVWTQLMTMDDSKCTSFQEAARHRGLVRNDREIDFILTEMTLSQCSTSEMCDFFALLLIWHDVGDASRIWEKIGEIWRQFIEKKTSCQMRELTIKCFSW